MSRGKDWEAFDDKKSEIMLQGLAVSAEEDTGNESEVIMDKNVHTPRVSEDGDDGTDDAQRALLNVDIVVADWITNVQPPPILPFDSPAAGVQHSIVGGCRQPAHFYELIITDLWKLSVEQTNIYGTQKNADWEDITVEKMKTYIALCMQMSVVKMQHLKKSSELPSVFQESL
ncbi:hypothetical protein KIN20_032323 [Parelaphostrongylus tenuis]|uniref:PiggyBac transposable element-derived protein domain-containing protein n=1 Tax=Parelaphostrongylus tenuis TaxID=148309 RepID=A0AAD5R6G3_PARTN|nr:hypothetical protein KIN20_025090 [Parelaphostrongylus tenuis]KAJ1364961.1 hypothetical protein KIN20_025160 [Parelaphostrongylus tenuis]KAJ1370573.1 hypothetical protein KIN20_032323 [Parelaphostrongylus tenuis]